MTKPLTIRPVDSATELGVVVDLVADQLDPPSDRADVRFTELKRAFPAQRDLLLVAEVHGRRVGGALGLMNSDVQATNARWFTDGDFMQMSYERHPGWSRWYASVLEPPLGPHSRAPSRGIGP